MGEIPEGASLGEACPAPSSGEAFQAASRVLRTGNGETSDTSQTADQLVPLPVNKHSKSRANMYSALQWSAMRMTQGMGIRPCLQ